MASRSEVSHRRRQIIGHAARRAGLVFREEMWRWGGELDAPSEGEIAMQFSDLVEKLERDGTFCITTGRLFVYKGEDRITLCLEVGAIDLAEDSE